MAVKTILVKRGLESARTGFVPSLGEIIWVTDTKELWVGDGVTVGGIKVTGNVEGAYIPASEKAAASGVATLDASGVIPTNQLPALAITSTFVATTDAEQNSHTSQEGDVCVRTDQNKSYIKNSGTAGDLTDWQELLTPTDAVISVNGKTGAITLSTDDVAEGSTNLYYTDARASSAADTRIAASSINLLADVNTAGATSDDYLKWNGTNWVPASPVALSIDNLSDVDTTTAAPATGNTLKWNGTAWVPATDDKVNTLGEIGNVEITSITDGQLITWDTATSKWTNTDMPSGVDGTFKGLTDTPSGYTAKGSYTVKVNAAENALEFVDESTIDGGTF